MRLITAHRILIGTFVAFLVFFGVFELREWSRVRQPANLALAVGAWAAAVGFSFYLRSLRGKGPDF